jgi:hypothetical protein
MISKLECMSEKTAPLLLKIPNRTQDTARQDLTVQTVSDKKILALLSEVEHVNKLTTLYDPTNGHILIIKFAPMYQSNIHCLIANVDNDILTSKPKIKDQILGHLAMIKSLLEAIYAS